jgi:hypothetical protein
LSLPIGRTEFWVYGGYLHSGHSLAAPLFKNCVDHKEAVEVATEEAKRLLIKEQDQLDLVCEQVNNAHMTFADALRFLKRGRQVKRANRNPWIYLKDGDLYLLDFDFGCVGSNLYEPTREDLLAENWEVRPLQD